MSQLFILLSFWEGVGGFIGAIACIFLFIFMPIALFAKLFNTNIVSRTGSNIANPNTFDDIVKAAKVGVEKSYSKIKSLNLKSYSDLKNENTSKLEKLSLLAKLKSEGIITEEEFQNLKAEILK